MGRRATGTLALATVLATFAGLFVIGSSDANTGRSVATRAAMPAVVCVAGYPRNSKTTYRKRPRVCNFLLYGAPIIHPGMVLSHATRWNHWGSEYARGYGRHFVNGGPRNGIPMKFWLSDPTNACGKEVFSNLRVRTRKLTYRPNAKRKYRWGRWLPWGDRIDLAVCTR